MIENVRRDDEYRENADYKEKLGSFVPSMNELDESNHRHMHESGDLA